MEILKHWAARLDDYIIDLGWSGNGEQLAAAASSGALVLFGAPDGGRTDLPGHEAGVNALAWHPSRPLLASGGQDGLVKFWDAEGRQHFANHSFGDQWIEQLAWRPDGECLAAAAGRQLVLLNGDATLRHALEPSPKTISALAWQATGGCLASACYGGVRLWDGDGFSLQKELPYANEIQALTWSPDGRWLVSGNQDPSVHLWLVEEGQSFHMSGYEGKVKALSFSPDGRQLATSGGDSVCVWDCSGAGPEGREPAMLPHEARVCAVAFQNRGPLLASAAEDGVLHLWNPAQATPLGATIKMPAPVTKIAWSPDDGSLALGSSQGIVYVLKVRL